MIGDVVHHARVLAIEGLTPILKRMVLFTPHTELYTLMTWIRVSCDFCCVQPSGLVGYQVNSRWPTVYFGMGWVLLAQLPCRGIAVWVIPWDTSYGGRNSRSGEPLTGHGSCSEVSKIHYCTLGKTLSRNADQSNKTCLFSDTILQPCRSVSEDPVKRKRVYYAKLAPLVVTCNFAFITWPHVRICACRKVKVKTCVYVRRELALPFGLLPTFEAFVSFFFPTDVYKLVHNPWLVWIVVSQHSTWALLPRLWFTRLSYYQSSTTTPA